MSSIDMDSLDLDSFHDVAEIGDKVSEWVNEWMSELVVLIHCAS
jgi:hypothetical protein